jgi:trk system potassium uptake protein TrkA
VRLIVIGSGSLAFHVARQSLDRGHHVVLVLPGRDEAARTDHLLPQAVVVAADGTDPEVLREAEASRADLVARPAITRT